MIYSLNVMYYFLQHKFLMKEDNKRVLKYHHEKHSVVIAAIYVFVFHPVKGFWLQLQICEINWGKIKYLCLKLFLGIEVIFIQNTNSLFVCKILLKTLKKIPKIKFCEKDSWKLWDKKTFSRNIYQTFVKYTFYFSS